MAFCRSCKAVINWYKTVAGRNMPLDPEPHPDGNVFIDVVRNEASIVPKGSRVPLYRSHFVTCPDAGKFRNPR